METNTITGILIALVGVTDIVLARVLADRLKLPPVVRMVLTIVGTIFVLIGAALALGMVRVVGG